MTVTDEANEEWTYSSKDGLDIEFSMHTGNSTHRVITVLIHKASRAVSDLMNANPSGSPSDGLQF